LFETPGVGAVEIELFYARVHLLWVRVFSGARECFKMLPVGVGLAFEGCVGVDEEVDGRYDLKLRWMPDDAVASDTDPPTLFTAIQEQLGLRLEPAKEPVPVLIVDHVDQPTPN
jgi:hypothetical protein